LAGELAMRTWPAAIVALTAWLGLATVQVWPRGSAQLAREAPRQGPQRLAVITATVLSFFAGIAGDRPFGEGVAELAGFALLAMLLCRWMWIGALRWGAWTLWGIAGLAIPLVGPDADPWLGLAVASAW